MDTSTVTSAKTPVTSRVWEDNDEYPHFLLGVSSRLNHSETLFTTNAGNLFAAFLEALPADRRQGYTCHACQNFVTRYGGLVTITQDGEKAPAMWDVEKTPAFFRPAVEAIVKLIRKARVNGVFITSEKLLGIPKTRFDGGVWTHLAVPLDKSRIFKNTVLKNADQAIAEKGEEYAMLRRGLDDYDLTVCQQTHQLLSTGNLYRSEKHVEMAKWLWDLQESIKQAPREGGTGVPYGRGDLRDALLWRAVASAPVGWCHVRSGLLGTLLDDVKAGLGFEEIKKKHDAKMNPLLYLRPQAAPAAGNIAQAEKVVGALEAAGSLARRFARLDDVQAIWKPVVPVAEAPRAGLTSGVFDHLKAEVKAGKSSVIPLVQPLVRSTWVKFRDTVLPTATEIELNVPATPGHFIALVTAVNPDAPPIIQWDHAERRNPVTWYVHGSPSSPSAWGLAPGWNKVTAVTLLPCLWNDGDLRQGKGVIFLLDGAKDSRDYGSALFPEFMRSEFHPVRATIEAHSKSVKIAGREEASACGWDFRDSTGYDWSKATLRVTTKAGGQQTYGLDRWD